MREYKLFQGKTLAILSGGGDTPAINSSIENIRNRAQLLGYKVYGIRHGWKGLLGDGDIVDLTNQPYDGIWWYCTEIKPLTRSHRRKIQRVVFRRY